MTFALAALTHGSHRQEPGDPDYRICYSQGVEDWDIYLTSEVAAWLDNLQATDAKTADLVDDASTQSAAPGPHSGGRSSIRSPARQSRT
jgi:hypothetical protein